MVGLRRTLSRWLKRWLKLRHSGSLLATASLLLPALVVGVMIGMSVGHSVRAVTISESTQSSGPRNKNQGSEQPSTIKELSSPAFKPPSTMDMHLILDATFKGTKLDTSIWDTCYPWANASLGCTNYGNSDLHEVEWYLSAQDRVMSGALHLIAEPVPVMGTNQSGLPELYPWRSGMVTTYDHVDFTYGYVQVVARLPAGPYFWPALWLGAANLQWPPEIDILELWGENTPLEAGMFYHPKHGAMIGVTRRTANLSKGWHTFALNWEPGSLSWYIDGKLLFRVTNNVPKQPMYFIANLAVTKGANSALGGSPVSSAAQLVIRSVKIWQNN